MQKLILFLSLFFLFTKVSAQIPNVVSGKIERLPNFNFKSKYVTSRNIDIWIPENYSKSKKYAVLYMHDGQMLYDSELTWNKQSWNVDDVISDLITNKKIQNTIIVGIWNDQKLRHTDYFPQKPFESLTANRKRYYHFTTQKSRKNQQSIFSAI